MAINVSNDVLGRLAALSHPKRARLFPWGVENLALESPTSFLLLNGQNFQDFEKIGSIMYSNCHRC